MAPAARSLLAAALALCGGSAGAALSDLDGLSLVQASQQAGSGAEAQLQTVALFGQALAERLQGWLARSSPKHHHDKHHDKHGKDGESAGEGESAEAAKASSEPAAQHESKAAARKKAKIARKNARREEDDDSTKCSRADFEAVDWHVKGLLAQNSKQVGDSLKAGDTNVTFKLIADMMPKECDASKLVSPAGVRWVNLQSCMLKASNASEGCASCPVTLLQRVAGRSVVEAPFSCAAKCGAVPAEAFKCAEDETQECKDAILEKMSPCLRCVAPHLVRFGWCAGLPSANSMKGKLKALLDAIDSGTEDLDKLLEKEASDGREELRKSKDSPVLTKVMALAMTTVLD